jgi:hypothetical protein
MPLAAHRKVPNRALELKERVWALVRARLGARLICTRCGARYATMDDLCNADLAERCPGSEAVEQARRTATQEVGLA